jgi:hypothetical protein
MGHGIWDWDIFMLMFMFYVLCFMFYVLCFMFYVLCFIFMFMFIIMFIVMFMFMFSCKWKCHPTSTLVTSHTLAQKTAIQTYPLIAACGCVSTIRALGSSHALGSTNGN